MGRTTRSRSRQSRAADVGRTERRIAALSRQPVPSTVGRENLDRPVDSDIQISGDPHAHDLSLMVDGQKVSWCRLIDFEQQIGPLTLRMGGVAYVGTHEKHRFKGYSRRVMENSLRWMRREGFDVTMLYGIADYYPKYGYAEAFPGVSHTMAVRDAERAPGGNLRFVHFAAAYLRAVLKMYHRNNAGRTGVIRRDPGRWVPFRKGVHFGSKAVARVGLDRRGRPAAYFVYDPGREVTVIEAGFATPAAFGAVLRAVTKLVWAVRQEKIRFLLPEDDAFMSFCRPYGLHKEIDYRRDGGAMVRMIHVAGALRKLAPLLGSRMSGIGRLTLRTDLDDAALRWSGGQMSVGKPRKGARGVAMPQWALAQLIYGYRRAALLAAEGIARGSKADIEVLEQMFPPTPHYHYAVDHF